ncbi:hypothetical protein ES703_108432 [subsurface metagenome]
MNAKSLWRVGTLVLIFILMGSIGSFGALTPADQLEKAIEYVNREDYGQAVDVLEDVLLTLREKAPLKIENTALVTEIYQFGMYDKRENSVFAPDEPILIYSEVRNFTSKKIGEELHAIRLNEDLQLLDVDNNLIIEQKEFGTVELNFRSLRVSDLFLRNTVTLSGLPSGDYKLKIIVTDVPSGKKADLVIPISIRGKRE